jgi:hypothetical protein
MLDDKIEINWGGDKIYKVLSKPQFSEITEKLVEQMGDTELNTRLVTAFLKPVFEDEVKSLVKYLKGETFVGR